MKTTELSAAIEATPKFKEDPQVHIGLPGGISSIAKVRWDEKNNCVVIDVDHKCPPDVLKTLTREELEAAFIGLCQVKGQTPKS